METDSLSGFRKTSDHKYKPSESRDWSVHGSSFENYMEDFRLLDRNSILTTFIEHLITKQHPVVIDLMASLDAVRSIFRQRSSNDEFSGLAVAYEDLRTPTETFFDEQFGLSQLSGNLNKTQTWKEIENWLGSKKADLIMQRGYGGLKFIPTWAPYYRSAAVRLWYMLNNQGGILLQQIPSREVLEARGIPIRGWVNKLEEAGIRHEYIPTFRAESHDIRWEYGLIMIEKGSESPTLPDIMNL